MSECTFSHIATKSNNDMPDQALETKTYALTNSVDPDETARNEPSHQDLHCLLFCY